MRLLLLVLFACALPLGGVAEALAACVAVGPTSAGSGNGTSWTNRRAGLPAGTAIVRGDTYYLMDGSYGTYTFSEPNSGTTRVTIKKAQAWDFGRTADGCSNDISSGWNAGTMGSGQAAFTQINGGQTQSGGLTPGYVTWDGNGQSSAIGCGLSSFTSAADEDCGIKLVSSVGADGCFDIGANNNDGLHRAPGWTIRYTECAGAGLIDEVAANNAGEENSIVCRGACDTLLLEHNYWYYSSCNFIKLPWTTSATFRRNHWHHNFSSGTCHGQFYISEVDTTNVEFAYNVISEIRAGSTGVWVVFGGGAHTDYRIHGNIFMRPSGSSASGLSNGMIACIHAELGTECYNWVVENNTFVNLTSFTLIYNEGVNSTYTFRNNLFYNSSGLGYNLAVFANGIQGSGTNTNTHNSYLNSGSPGGGTSTVTVTSGAPNPFVNWNGAAPNMRLTSDQANTNNGLTLASPYNIDPDGNARGADGAGKWDRGAYEFGGTTAAPSAPTNFRIE